MAMTVESSDGIRIRFDVAGSGDPALVFVYGWSCDRTYWRHQVATFSATHRTVTIDLAGHGESASGRTAWTMASFGADVAAVVEHLDLDRAVLIGHSMGGDVVVEAARLLGERVAGLVWVDTYRSLGVEEPLTGGALDAALEPFRQDFVTATSAFVEGLFPPGSDPALVQQVASDMAAAPPDVAISALGHAWANEGLVIPALQELHMPIVALDPADGRTDAASLGRYGIETVSATGVGHFPMLEDPAQFDRLLAATLRMSMRPGSTIDRSGA